MEILTIFISAIAGTAIISGAITHSSGLIKKELSDIRCELEDINENLERINIRKVTDGLDQSKVAKSIESLRKILARNFRIAMNDDEFERL